MPDSQGRLTDNERAQLIAWAETKAPNGFVCPITGERTKWTLGEFAVTPMKLNHDGDFVVGPSEYPIQVFFANEHGSIIYVSALTTGVHMNFTS